MGVPDAMQGQSHHVSTIEDVSIVTGAANRGDFAAVKTDGDMITVLWLTGAGWFCHNTTQVETCAFRKGDKDVAVSLQLGAKVQTNLEG